MKSSKIIIFFFLIILINSDEIEIDFSKLDENPNYYIIERNTVILSKENVNYTLKGESNIYNIKVSSSCSIKLDSLKLTSPAFAAILIEENKEVIVNLNGNSELIDTSSNQNDGVIYLNEEAKLIIEGEGTLNIYPNKHMAIFGVESSSLTVNNGTINIKSTANDVGGIYLSKEIIFNDGAYNFNIDVKTVNSINPPNAIDSKGSITIKKGKYEINSGEGKGIKSESYLYIGENNTDLNLNIETRNKGIEAKGIEIFYGVINITSYGDGINVINDECNLNCKGNCRCYIKIEGGDIYINSGEDGIDSKGDIFINNGKLIVFGASSGDNQPIDKDGLLYIKGGNVLAGGSPVLGGVQANTTQTEGVYVKHIDANTNIIISKDNGESIINVETPKAVEFLYFSISEKTFIMKLNDIKVETNSTSIFNEQQSGQTHNLTDESNISFFLCSSKILILLVFILF